MVPYIFVYNPALLLIDVTPLGVIQIVITSVIGIIGVGSAVAGFLLTNESFLERIIFFIGGIMLVTPGLRTDFIGGGLLLLGYLIQRRKFSKSRIQGVKN